MSLYFLQIWTEDNEKTLRAAIKCDSVTLS